MQENGSIVGKWTELPVPRVESYLPGYSLSVCRSFIDAGECYGMKYNSADLHQCEIGLWIFVIFLKESDYLLQICFDFLVQGLNLEESMSIVD